MPNARPVHLQPRLPPRAPLPAAPGPRGPLATRQPSRQPGAAGIQSGYPWAPSLSRRVGSQNQVHIQC